MSVSEESCSFNIACVCTHYKPRNLQSNFFFLRLILPIYYLVRTVCTSLTRLQYIRSIGLRLMTVREIPLQNADVQVKVSYEGHLESKERFAIQKYLLIIGKKNNMQVLSYTFTYFST